MKIPDRLLPFNRSRPIMLQRTNRERGLLIMFFLAHASREMHVRPNNFRSRPMTTIVHTLAKSSNMRAAYFLRRWHSQGLSGTKTYANASNMSPAQRLGCGTLSSVATRELYIGAPRLSLRAGR